MRSVGKQPLQQSGKYRVNKNDEENFRAGSRGNTGAGRRQQKNGPCLHGPFNPRKLALETYDNAFDELAKQNFRGASPEVRTELLEFFGHPDAPYAMKRKRKQWARVLAEVEELKMAVPATAATSGEDPQ